MLESRRPSWLLPGPAFVELGLALTRLAIAGLIAIAISGLVAAAFGTAFGRTFVAGDRPGFTYAPARCADFFEYSPGASSCEEAATWHHYGEVVQYRLGAGVLGLALLAAYAFARRRLPTVGAVLPPGFEATIGAVMYGLAAVYLLGISADGLLLHETAGIGGPLSGGGVSATMAVGYGLALYRILLRRARPDATG